MKKSNWKRILLYCCIAILLTSILYTRFINIGWGLPYPMHPDERNMASAVQSLHCEFSIFNFQFSNDCLNPHFFAYGQFPLYLAYFLIGLFRWPMAFVEAVLALRIIAAIASLINVFVLYKILTFLNHKSEFLNLFLILIFIFSPALIQLAHFGTTESLLMLFYSLIIYQTLPLLHDRNNLVNVILLAVWSGLAIATKVSAGIFVLIPVAVLMYKRQMSLLIKYGVITGFFALIFSPYNLIAFGEFTNSIRYESDVALGRILVFYTRQFVDTVPVLFQFTKIFPYALGWPALILFVAGFLFLPWKKEINLLRLAFLVYFIPNAFLFAKWTRFMSPVFPIMLVFAVLFVISLSSRVPPRDRLLQHFIKGSFDALRLPKMTGVIIIIIIAIIPGVAYLRIYQSPDVRFTATEWIDKNIPRNSLILSETANVVDIPFDTQNYRYISFDFYHLDEDRYLQNALRQYLATANYIIVPSRRVFMNHPQTAYPILNSYYRQLFAGKSGFKPAAEFGINKTDELAEETWSVFDHPAIRIYKKNNL